MNPGLYPVQSFDNFVILYRHHLLTEQKCQGDENADIQFLSKFVVMTFAKLFGEDEILSCIWPSD